MTGLDRKLLLVAGDLALAHRAHPNRINAIAFKVGRLLVEHGRADERDRWERELIAVLPRRAETIRRAIDAAIERGAGA